MIGFICVGKPDFDAIELFRDDPFFTQSLCLNSVPSSPTLRQRLDSARGGFNNIILEESLRLVFRVTLRTMEADGQVLLIPKVEVKTYWTALGMANNRTIDSSFTYSG